MKQRIQIKKWLFPRKRSPRPMMGRRERRRRRRVLIGVGIAAGLAVVIALAGAISSRRTGKSVNVYDIRDQFAMTDYWGDGSQTDGSVGLEGIQQVFLSDTMSVREVLVREGQSVKKGDTLLTYDTTLTELDVQLKEVKVRQAELDLTNAQKALATVNSYRAGQLIPGTGPEPSLPETPEEQEEEQEDQPFQEDGTVPLLEGKGTYEEPFVYRWKAGYRFDDAFLYQVMRGSKNCFVRFLMTGQGGAHIHVPDYEGWYTDELGHYHICALCGQEFDRADHSFLEVVDQYPGPGVEGSKHQVCGVCGFVGETVPIPPLTEEPTDAPTDEPTDAPTERPTQAPTQAPDDEPTEEPTEEPDDEPTEAPTEEPTEEPTDEPTEAPTDPPTEEPTEPETQMPEMPEQEPEGNSSSATTPSPDLPAEVMMQFQATEYGANFQIISIRVPSQEGEEAAPVFDWRDSAPLPDPTEAPTEETPTEAPAPEPDGLRFTEEELAQMRTEAAEKVRDLELDLRRCRLDYDKALQELNNSAIYAEMDGKVRDLMDPTAALRESGALLHITAGGGYYITCTLSELERDTVQVGQKVTVTSWTSGGTYEGTVTEISDYPAAGNNYGSGNSNVSYYPFKVFVDESAGLREGDYVGVQYSAAQGQQGFYLQSMFIRSENGKYYVLADRDGTLSKQYVTTGKSLWGSYTQILSGITPDDRLAFPYGSGVKEGAPAVLASADALYGY